jgi:hypothetical protein
MVAAAVAVGLVDAKEEVKVLPVTPEPEKRGRPAKTVDAPVAETAKTPAPDLLKPSKLARYATPEK